ncbi:MAG: histidinol-phosphate transaminase [Muribaculaceae bacterium]
MKEFNLKELIRPNILRLEPYSSARSEFKGTASTWLDANENPFSNPYNRYPDPLQLRVKAAVSRVKGVADNRIFLGVGSDECIDLAYRIFCRPGVDNVVAMAPSYGMYEVCANINDVEYRKVMLGDNFSLDSEALLAATDANTRLMWLCSPNNPTGNAFACEQLADLCRRFCGIVIVDEAYIDFSDKGSMLTMLDELPNLIVMQTFSKAWGSAAVRLGMAFASPEIIDYYNKVKYPYNVNQLAQEYALKALADAPRVKEWVKQLLANRAWLANALAALPLTQHIYASDANFILVKVSDANGIYAYLRDRGIIVRNRNRIEKCLGCLRITVGTEQENETLINALAEYGKQ